jgi:hypothetical protein
MSTADRLFALRLKQVHIRTGVQMERGGRWLWRPRDHLSVRGELVEPRTSRALPFDKLRANGLDSNLCPAWFKRPFLL